MRMKAIYKWIILGLLLLAVVLSILSYCSWLGREPQAARLIYILTGLAIAVTAVIALSNADIPKEQVKVSIKEPYVINEEREEYQENELANSLKAFYNIYPVISYRVHFKMKNISGFDLKNPVITFNKLPIEKQRPLKKEENDTLYSIRHFTFSIIRADRKSHFLEIDGKYQLICLDGLPYWNDCSEIDLWVRMVLVNGGSDSFDVEVSINCENADGFSQTVKINSKELIPNTDKKDKSQK